jgi:hypothetical protein
MGAWKDEELDILAYLLDSHKEIAPILHEPADLAQWVSEQLPRRNCLGLFRKLKGLKTSQEQLIHMFGLKSLETHTPDCEKARIFGRRTWQDNDRDCLYNALCRMDDWQPYDQVLSLRRKQQILRSCTSAGLRTWEMVFFKMTRNDEQGFRLKHLLYQKLGPECRTNIKNAKLAQKMERHRQEKRIVQENEQDALAVACWKNTAEDVTDDPVLVEILPPSFV